MTAATETLSSILQRGVVRVGFQAPDFASAVRALLAQPLRDAGVEPSRVDEVIACVLEREQAGTTCTGPVALPHGRAQGIDAIVAGLGISRDVIYPGGSARVMLAFVSPHDAASEHLRFLSLAAKTLRDPALLGRLQAAATPGEVFDLLRASAA
jgi:mannitol/fructose-specific phosphotransferase system IIA component (Ntr-type)